MEEGDVADWAEYQGEWDYKRASYHPELDNPDIADGVSEGAYEGDSYGDVAEGEPVGAVSDEWVSGIGIVKAVSDFYYPLKEACGGLDCIRG